MRAMTSNSFFGWKTVTCSVWHDTVFRYIFPLLCSSLERNFETKYSANVSRYCIAENTWHKFNIERKRMRTTALFQYWSQEKDRHKGRCSLAMHLAVIATVGGKRLRTVLWCLRGWKSWENEGEFNIAVTASLIASSVMASIQEVTTIM